MSRFLLLDIGAGTLDVLWYDTESVHHYKAVVVSPVRTIAEQAARLTGDLLVTGCEMGGGPVTTVLRERAETHAVVMSASAAATLAHDLAQVRAWGITVVGDDEAETLRRRKKHSHLVLRMWKDRLSRSWMASACPEFEAAAICAQDHGAAGVSPPGFRHNVYRGRLDAQPLRKRRVRRRRDPPVMNRLSMAESAGAPADEIYVMDSGMAAITGAACDMAARNTDRFMVLDIATSHTVCAAMLQGELAGFAEYHTRDITRERLEGLLRDLADGRLDHAGILAEGGHGAYLRKTVGPEALDTIIATGPKRRMVTGSRLPMVWGAPLGDNMMTGTVGLLEALRRRKKLDPIFYG
jgi:uncharacterized protein (DUF1786 family)